MTGLETALLAARLISVSVVLLLVPGFLLLMLLRASQEWPERILFAFSLSYCWIFALSIAIPALGWTADAAGVMTLIAIALLVIALIMHRGAAPHGRRSPDRFDLLLLILIIAAAIAGWIIEPAFTGEEALDFVSISRFADGGPILFSNTSLIPDARPVYLFQPYQLALGIIARWSGIDPLVAFIKFRVILAPLALTFLFALVRRLTLTRADAAAVFLIILVFVGLDLQTWEMNSLFPLVRRGGLGAGLCVPAMLVLCLVATRAMHEQSGRAIRRIALATAPVMLAASLATHPLEMFTVLVFVAALCAAILLKLDRLGDLKQVAILLLLLVVSAGGYVAVQSSFVPYVAEYEADDKRQLRVELGQLATNPLAAVAGEPTPAADLLTRTIPATTATVFGLAALPIAALRAPATAATLALATAPLALAYAMPAGFILLTLMTSVETVRDVNAYFGLFGLIGLSIAFISVAHAALNGATWRRAGFRQVVVTAFSLSIAGLVVVSLGLPTARALGDLSITQPATVLTLGAIAAAATLIVARSGRQVLVPPAPLPVGVVALAVVLAIPFAMPETTIGGVFTKREATTVITRLDQIRSDDSVLNWPGYYERLKAAIAPPLPLPRAVIDELRRRVPPRQVVLADPRYSCALVVLLDAYCINPASIYGHYFQPAIGYFRDYVTERGDAPEHPFFNSNVSLSDAERSLLQQRHIDYVLSDPQFDNVMASKLANVAADARLETRLDGYALYRVTGNAARTPGQ